MFVDGNSKRRREKRWFGGRRCREAAAPASVGSASSPVRTQLRVALCPPEKLPYVCRAEARAAGAAHYRPVRSAVPSARSFYAKCGVAVQTTKRFMPRSSPEFQSRATPALAHAIVRPQRAASA